MAPVLDPHTNTNFALGNQQDPTFILGCIPRCASRAFSFPFLLFECALGVFGGGYLVG